MDFKLELVAIPWLQNNLKKKHQDIRQGFCDQK